MATRAVYRLLDTGRLSGPQDGHRFPTGGRTDWAFTFDVQALDGVTAVDVRIEASGTGNTDAEFETIHAATLSAEATTFVESGFSGRELASRDVWIRAVVASVTGTGHYAIRVFAAAPFLRPDSTEDQLYLRREVRDYDDGAGVGQGRTRLVERAEADVLGRLRMRPDGGLPLADLTRTGALEAMKAAVAMQTEHLFKREMLTMSGNVQQNEAASKMAEYAPGLDDVLSPVMHAGLASVWMGR